MIVVVHKEVLHSVGADKAALCVEAEGRGTLPCAHKQGISLEFFAVVHDIMNETSALSLFFGPCRKVFDLEDAFALLGHNAHALHIGIAESEHGSPVEIERNHVHLFVCQKQQVGKVELLS